MTEPIHPNASAEPEVEVTGNVYQLRLTSRATEPEFSPAERAELRRMMRQMENLATGCPTARRLTREE